MKLLQADLHVHTCLSPCADKEMTPSRVVKEAKEKHLNVIAVCDHNSIENVEVAQRAGARAGISVIGGIEICSREEVHVLGLFPVDGGIGEAQEAVYDNLPGENDVERFGEQLVMDEEDNVARRNRRLLIGAVELPLRDIVRLIHKAGGLAIAAHVDRPSYSVLSQLGFFPADLELDGAEVFFGKKAGIPDGLPVIESSDAHFPEDIGMKRTRFLVESGAFPEIRMALKGESGRKVVCSAGLVASHSGHCGEFDSR